MGRAPEPWQAASSTTPPATAGTPMKQIPLQQAPEVLAEAIRGMAKMQARQEMLECFVRALIAEAPPAHPLFWKALHTAKSDLESRSARARPHNPPEMDAAALELWNELMRACAPPTGGAQSS